MMIISFVPPGNWVIDTTQDPTEIQTSPKCGGKFASKFTTTDTKFYPSNPPYERRRGKKRVVILEGTCGSIHINKS